MWHNIGIRATVHYSVSKTKALRAASNQGYSVVLTVQSDLNSGREQFFFHNILNYISY